MDYTQKIEELKSLIIIQIKLKVSLLKVTLNDPYYNLFNTMYGENGSIYNSPVEVLAEILNNLNEKI